MICTHLIFFLLQFGCFILLSNGTLSTFKNPTAFTSNKNHRNKKAIFEDNNNNNNINNKRRSVTVISSKAVNLNKPKQNTNILLLYLRSLPEGVKNGIASGLSTIIAKSILQPFDTIKTIQQTSTIHLTPLTAITETIRTRGVLGLWSGMGITIIGSTPSTSVYFGLYSTTKATLVKYIFTSPDYNLLTVALSASIANTFASFIRAPFEVIKQRLQTGAYKSTLEVIKYSFEKDGLFGLFSKGKLMSQIIRDVPYAVMTLLAYEILQTAVKAFITTYELNHPNINIGNKNKISRSAVNHNSNNSSIHTMNMVYSLSSQLVNHSSDMLYGFLIKRPLRDALCGSLAGGFGSLMTTPMDLLKTRMMTSSSHNSASSLLSNPQSSLPAMTMYSTVLSIARTEGWGTFFRGATPRLMHKIPANAIFFLFYEELRSLLGIKMTKA